MIERPFRCLVLSSVCAVALLIPGPIGDGAAASVAAQARSSEGRPGDADFGRVPGPGNWEWWNDADVQRAIGLTPEKVEKLDGHYRYRSRELAPVVKQWLRERDELDELTRAATVDESTYTLQVLTVEALRSKISESRTVMIYRMFRELTPEQYQKLREIFSNRRRGGGRGPE